jgi:hypothetical protein
MKLKEHEKLWLCSMGKRFQVTAIFHDDESANAYLARHKDEGVIAVVEPYVFIAHLYRVEKELRK